MKKTKWTTTKLIALGSISVIIFITRFIVYVSILGVTGNVFAGLIGIFIQAFFVVLNVLVIDQMGAATIFALLIFITDLSTPAILPQPIKLVVFLLGGLCVDIAYKYLKNKKLLSFVGGFLDNFVQMITVIALFFSIGISKVNVPQFITSPVGVISITVIASILGGLAGMGAYLVYQKIKKTTIVKRIQR